MPSNTLALPDFAAFSALVDALARSGRADLFLSGLGCAGAGRSVIGFEPMAKLAVEEGTGKDEVAEFCFGSPEPALGYLGYGYGLALRGMKSSKHAALPAGCLRKYGAYLEYDADTGSLDVFGPDDATVEAARRLAEAPPGAQPFVPPSPADTEQSLSREEYEEGVRRTLEHIRAGNTYQLNLSIRFSRPATDLDAPGLFRHLWLNRPAPFYAFMHVDGREIVSTSPERYLRVEDGEVLSQPIKGTLAFDAYDPALALQLAASPKESAELSMIVDLMRNDIAENCEYGSVKVQRHKSTFTVDRLIQMYSEVHGKLREDRTCVDLFLDAFPPGSVTGCPKRRSLEIIEELEPHARDAYCGSFVIIRGPRDMDSNVAIRTGWKDAATGEFSFFAGSGIVVDSVPEMEYEETVAKAEKFIQLGRK